MKHYIGISAVFLIILSVISGCGGKNAQQGEDSISKEMIYTVPPNNDTLKDIVEESTDILYLPGDTLYEYDGNTIMLRLVEDEDEASSVSFSEITTYADNKPIRVCRVKGYSSMVTTTGKTLKVGIGIDTMKYRLISLPKTIDPVKDLAGILVRKHSIRHKFKAGDYPLENSFHMAAYLQDVRPDYINRMIAAIIHRDLEIIFSDDTKRPDLRTEYQKLEENPERYKGLNIDSATPKEVGKYFARRYENHYKKQNSNGGWNLNEYVLETAPVWNSDDGSLTTYRFYTYHYDGGAHGIMNEFYLTFDNNDGRVLGYRDILGDEGIKTALVRLKKELNVRIGRDSDYPYAYTADLGKDGVDNFNDRMLNEEFEEFMYPRPAITKDGIVFSYQPYEKGSFADGIIHILLSKRFLKANDKSSEQGNRI